MKKSHIVILVVLAVLILDQWLKIYVKLNFTLEEDIAILGLSWARLHFTENNGMAFGITFAGEYGKLFLSVFRIIAVGFLAHFIYRLIQANESTGLLVSFTLILAGAIGNVLDCLLYGVIFSNSAYHGEPAVLFPRDGGYAPILYGRVVDMLYFPLVDSRWPEWMPIWGGERFQFFRFIFNVADAAITTGVISILLFHRRFFKPDPPVESPAETFTVETTTEQNLQRDIAQLNSQLSTLNDMEGPASSPSASETPTATSEEEEDLTKNTPPPGAGPAPHSPESQE